MTDVDWNFQLDWHHGAEIALLRDLYRWHFDGKGA
jgi:hypothetical protein